MGVRVAPVRAMLGARAMKVPVSYTHLLLVVEQGEDAMGDGDRRVLGVATGGEGVGRVRGNHIDFRHGDTVFGGEALDGLVGAGELLAGRCV